MRVIRGITVVGLLTLCGCQGAPERYSVAGAPMFASKRGILTAPESARPLPAFPEPTPPGRPVAKQTSGTTSLKLEPSPTTLAPPQVIALKP